ncbi:hypothetical protein ACFWBI_08905 [Streptomyces sp. NPDC059982]|uniref:hypothetical protein n=1 Tax=unclassified Streptomyces TaxID=2593676 RepID=UPI0036B46D29
MHRETRFLISRKPYAIELTTITGEQHQRGNLISFSGTAHALWFRRKASTTYACTGSLMLFSHHLPARLDLNDPQAILSADLDGRYGGTAHGRWDGTRYWGAQEPLQMGLDLTLLEPMLANYPAIPDDYDGWWTFQPTA